MATTDSRILEPARREGLLAALATRFERNAHRRPGIAWEEVRARLEASPDKLWSLNEMERSGGEPDVVARDGRTKGLLFVDCSPESPAGRRSLCYDGAALAARKKNRPDGSAVEAATAMGAELLTEAEYRLLQDLGAHDTRTSSWLKTPPAVRSLGGAIFGDHRFGTVWVYHNGAESYYAARGFRCALRV
ncbi:MAG: DUF4256 domain-containing protein [Gemmatimonadales bacterium]|nr:MAG: DUF4256 domain-containing protein [Gemmatimonadales bacterium]